LYNQVAMSTMNDPRRKVNVMTKLNNATEARKDMTMLKLVANPLSMLSEYLMTMAVTNPPATCVKIVAHAHTPKFSKRDAILHEFKPSVDLAYIKKMGESAGRSENMESCTLRTQTSAEVFLRTISK